MPVVGLKEGERIATIHDVLIDTGKLEATALLLGRHSGLGVLLLSSIKSIGPEEITIENDDEIQWAISRNHQRSESELGDLTKFIVLDSNGTFTGILQDINIELPSGAITSLAVRRGSLFGDPQSDEILSSEIVSVGPGHVTVRGALAAG